MTNQPQSEIIKENPIGKGLMPSAPPSIRSTNAQASPTAQAQTQTQTRCCSSAEKVRKTPQRKANYCVRQLIKAPSTWPGTFTKNRFSAANYRPERSAPPSSTIASVSGKGRRSSSSSRRSSATQQAVLLGISSQRQSVNRVHRRVIFRDYGTPIYKASSRTSLLAALDGCIEGHESLRNAGIIHRDISVNNLLINEDDNNPSWPSLLIDLDLAIKEQREGVSGAKGKTGTRAFMAVGALLGEQHSFMHDLESFFWVLF
ncbi:hypothetical protein B0T24DRAFT_598320 [Lasiosphaeria ovina]|uniref:EKC/KEOPS complex subunit BUD32 n=1 Tax=Lasiosphaeria ovina TaxID=92902 RepID=A0AAE0JVV4_9PEZI|nr:hypothetical protein B0T24DRAFT_598320 [Lasiosphaeria ovina]